MSATEPYAVLNIADIEPIPAAGILWKPLRRPLGIDAFGINAYTAVAAGDHVIESHTESTLGHQEVYVVIAGHATFTVDGAEIDAPSGSVVFVRDHSLRRGAVAVAAGTTILAIGGAPGTHSPSAWEWYFAAEQYRASRDYDAALALLADGLERFPDNSGMIYSIACWEAMAGNTDAAITALNRAFELNPDNVGWAKSDSRPGCDPRPARLTDLGSSNHPATGGRCSTAGACRWAAGGPLQDPREAWQQAWCPDE